MIKHLTYFGVLAMFLSQNAYCMIKTTTPTSASEHDQNTHWGPSLPKVPLKKPKPIGEVKRNNLKSDEVRDSFYSGHNLSQFPKTTPAQVNYINIH